MDGLSRRDLRDGAVHKFLRHSERHYRLLFESNPQPVWVYDAKTLQFLEVNQSAVRKYGYSREEFLAMTLRDIRIQEDNSTSSGTPSNPGVDPETIAVRKHRKRDGTPIDAEITSVPLTLNGRAARLDVATDITARKRANAELTAANRELESFSYSVSHDLRAPLRSISGFSTALLEDFGDSLNAEARDYLRRIRLATERMGILIDDLLNLSRLARTKMTVGPVDLSNMAKLIALELQKTQPERLAEFRIEDGLQALADPHLMRIAFENLLGNAWKFTSKRERALIELGKAEGNGTPAYFVRDNGAGFDPAYKDHLFGAFQRLHNASDFPGTGVGLATVERIIRRHGGRIWAEGAVEQGATFYFTLSEKIEAGASAKS